MTRALAIDPYFYPALLHKGMLLERLGKRRQAARVFKDVLKIMPDARAGRSRASAGPRSTRAAAIQENRQSLERHLDTVLADLRGRHSAARLDRFEETVKVMTGAKKRYSPEPVMLHFAQLPPLQFYDSDLFPWIPELEAATDDIRRECEAVLAEQRDEFDPYIQYPPGAPVNQWQELNHSPSLVDLLPLAARRARGRALRALPPHDCDRRVAAAGAHAELLAQRALLGARGADRPSRPTPGIPMPA